MRLHQVSKRVVSLGLSLVLLAGGHVSAASVQEDLNRIGTWDGVTASRPLPGNYTDWSEQNVPFGVRSFYAAPWRSYMDTRDAPSLINSLGINFNNTIKPEAAEATAQVLQDAGITSARLEIPWKEISFDDESKLNTNADAQLTTILNAFKNHHIRPLILLNANAGLPVPYKMVPVSLKQQAKAGDRAIYVSDVSGIVPGYTGLQGQEYQSMYPIITAVDAATGQCILSDALKADLRSGSQNLIRLKYRPFSGVQFSDGTKNGAAQETIDGWLNYVATVSDFVARRLGTKGQADAGFDVEVWNEYSFGSQFLDINNYYNPPLKFSADLSYTEGTNVKTGAEVILPLTANYIKNPEHQLPGVQVISGFSNQRPWDDGATVWKNQDGLSKHYYTGFDQNGSVISSSTVQQYPTVNALGASDPYVPTQINSFPEYWFYSYQTEFAREAQPFPGPFADHYRYASIGGGKEAQLWMSETNYHRGVFAGKLVQQKGIQPTNPQLVQLMHSLETKALLRSYVFFQHKGFAHTFPYAINGGDLEFGIVPDAFFSALESNGYLLDSSAKSKVGPEIQSITNLVQFMKAGESIANPRKLNVDRILEYKPRIVYNGDGTDAHPARYQAEDLAILPYQLAANQFAIGYYVVTRNLTHAWDASKDELDPARYEMPDQDFEITLSNVNGVGASVYAFDPIHNSKNKVEIVSSTGSTITVKAPTADYPRFLVVQEAEEGPLLGDVQLQKTKNGPALTFTPNVDGNVKISWGAYPARETGAVTVRRYQHFDANLTNPVATGTSGSFGFNKTLGTSGDSNGYYRITGKIEPQFSEKYTFIYDGECRTQIYLNGKKLIDSCQPKMQASVDLEAGKTYDLEVVTFYENNGDPHSAYLYWSSSSQSFSVVPAKPDGSSEMYRSVTKNEKATVLLPDLKDGDGVRLELAKGGVNITYPQWDFDLRGVLYPTMPIVEVGDAGAEPRSLQVSPDTPLYEQPDACSAVVGYLAAQTVKAVEKRGEFYRIDTWLGYKWVHESNVVQP
ncbi:PA14 domain-containing protein [Paenibacillus cremeus]|uniref:PA14 domain-containing protein n=1 Tax=Paenibacillus cremeus TaxID=2163881 RepID=A0A559KFM2_9BACL|nr:PA14 domain-containing protein [Paenibacillus cremeus]TVY10917.1 hypothetical protein FPZ49_05415 [Paenibacillus cremeus]